MSATELPHRYEITFNGEVTVCSTSKDAPGFVLAKLMNKGIIPADFEAIRIFVQVDPNQKMQQSILSLRYEGLPKDAIVQAVQAGCGMSALVIDGLRSYDICLYHEELKMTFAEIVSRYHGDGQPTRRLRIECGQAHKTTLDQIDDFRRWEELSRMPVIPIPDMGTCLYRVVSDEESESFMDEAIKVIAKDPTQLSTYRLKCRKYMKKTTTPLTNQFVKEARREARRARREARREAHEEQRKLSPTKNESIDVEKVQRQRLHERHRAIIEHAKQECNQTKVRCMSNVDQDIICRDMKSYQQTLDHCTRCVHGNLCTKTCSWKKRKIILLKADKFKTYCARWNC